MSNALGVFTILLSWLCLVLLTWAAERALTPRPQSPSHRSLAANLTHALALLALFGAGLAITARPGLALALALVLVVLVVLVNQDKQRTLREPFLACDFIYFWDVISHPKLYLPYFGYVRASIMAASLAILVWLWWQLEPALRLGDQTLVTRTLGLIMVALGAWLANAWARTALMQSLSLNPSDDLKSLGLIAMLLAHQARAKLEVQPDAVSPQSPWLGLQAKREPVRDHGCDNTVIVCIQIESFADFRRIYPDHAQTRELALPAWDGLRAQAWATGALAVAAWGANTVRSEFEFLMGVPVSALGVSGFEPYQMIARTSADRWRSALPASLARLGYTTSLVHPYDRRFYQRDRVATKLGFQEFFDIKGFEREGLSQARSPMTGYISDVALGHVLQHKILAQPADKPLLLHAITMQGHGPYARGADRDSPQAILAGYLECLKDTDRMLAAVAATLRELPRPAVLCVYGDHLPIMPQVYDTWGMPEGHTDYLVWRNQDQARGRVMDGAAHELGAWTLTAAGFEIEDGA